MDTQRLILFAIFVTSLFLLGEEWNRGQRAAEAPPVAATTDKSGVVQGTAPPAPTTKLDSSPPNAPGASPAAPPSGVRSGEIVRIATDSMNVEIDTAGASVVRVELPAHKATLDRSKTFVLLERTPESTYVAQTGLTGEGVPNHNSRFTSAAPEYRLAEGQDKLEVRFESQTTGPLGLVKIFTFQRGSYAIDVRHEVRNTGSTALQPYAYFQLLRDSKPPAGDSAMVPTYTGAAVYTEQEKYQKVAFGDIDKKKLPYPKTSNDGWIAMVQHYFVAAVVPPQKVAREFYTTKLDNGLYSAGVILPVGTVEPGATAVQSVTLYVGPQEQESLAKLATGLDLTVDYGWLTVIAAPLFWVLKQIHAWAHNWGVAIILLTVLIKLFFYPLSAASYRSMAKMRVVAPKLQKLKEQYGDDRQRMNQAMMELYKTEKINPLGGCLPILVQIPVFISLYWVLLASVELRHAPFMLWINDLSAPDPIFILPVLMGATMIIQTRLNPEPPDPIQAKIMKIMPIAFSVFFFFFPAGLVLYWLVNNILSIAQQWQITRTMERAAPAHGRR
jgi:YidC/Oxa1 family membrane protein insertase